MRQVAQQLDLAIDAWQFEFNVKLGRVNGTLLNEPQATLAEVPFEIHVALNQETNPRGIRRHGEECPKVQACGTFSG